MQKLNERFPNSPLDFSLLYLGTTWLPRDLDPLLRVARRRGAPIIVNQDGVAYPGWAGDRTEEINRPLRRAVLAADHVVYQSEFSKLSADLYLGEPTGSWEILPNAVDVEPLHAGDDARRPGGRFCSSAATRRSGTVSSSRCTRWRVASAAFRRAAPRHRTSCLRPPSLSSRSSGYTTVCILLGEYAQRDAPGIFRRAHVLLHTKVKDPCPTLVLEAMASGLPVVYPASGGTVELVGDEAGIGVPHPDTWERDEPPTPESSQTPSAASSPTSRVTRLRPGRASSTVSHSSRGSTVTASSSRASPRGSRGVLPSRVAAWKPAVAVSRRARDTATPPTGRIAMRASIRRG